MAITQVGAAPAHRLLILGIHWMEAIMRTSITRLIIAAAVATVVASGTPVARSLAAPPVPQESLPNRDEPPLSETDFRLGDHQQLRGYFLDGSRERVR
jgi:hypothetical protein